ncbi:methionine s-methyltransferase [Hibiscus syriacus]|uniref:Methionine s-methyltransferase n=1 Tax=Hibiscus syriacus TaxID=106335 RepID=A0A6A2ZLW8_HIBSY|nr:methionine s-methyltransferase [Hibiscus syriacus]
MYKARDLDSNKLVSLKKVRFVNMDPESTCFMASLHLIFEYMARGLTELLAAPEIKFTEAQESSLDGRKQFHKKPVALGTIKCYMQQLLRGLNHCHSHGVLHRDIKGSNLLIDCNGNLKTGEFGLATFFHPNQTKGLTWKKKKKDFGFCLV